MKKHLVCHLMNETQGKGIIVIDTRLFQHFHIIRQFAFVGIVTQQHFSKRLALTAYLRCRHIEELCHVGHNSNYVLFSDILSVLEKGFKQIAFMATLDFPPFSHVFINLLCYHAMVVHQSNVSAIYQRLTFK